MLYKNDQNGFAIVYGLLVLFLVTAGGMSILFISGKDKESSTDYTKIREATIAADAAHKAFIGFCEKEPDSLIKLLTKFSSAPKYCWLFTDKISQSVTEKKVPLIPGQPTSKSSSFSAKILKYNKLTYTIEIEAHGYCSNWRDEQKKTTGIYKLNGLKKVIELASVPTHALYLGGGFGDGNSQLTIDGNVYAGGKNHINGSGTLIINGSFKTGTEESTINTGLTIHGNAYFRCNVKFQGGTAPYMFMGKTGFEKTVSLNCHVNVNNNLYLNGFTGMNSNNNKFILPNNTDTAFYTYFNRYMNISATNAIQNTMYPINIASAVQMVNVDDTVPKIRSDLENYITDEGGTIYTPSTAGLNFSISGWNLNTAFNTKNKWNGFLVIKVDKTYSSGRFDIKKAGDTFNGKAIWIVDNVVNKGDKWYSSAPNSNTLIYLVNNAYLEEFKFNGEKFRGVIYSNEMTTPASYQRSSYRFSSNSEICGSIIHRGENKQTAIQGNKAKIKYDKKVIEELAFLGIWDSDDPSSSNNSSKEMIVSDIKIRPQLLGINY